MENHLPTEFDLVVIGTGLVESVISAAASRIGKRVLHIDSNNYYGRQWASFNLETINSLSFESQNSETEVADYVSIGNDIFNIQNITTKFHIPDCKSDLKQSLESLTYSDDVLRTSADQDKSELRKDTDTTHEKAQGQKFTKNNLLSNSRKFNIDLVPKLHFARGEFVELLISSNIARYAEYRSVSRILTYLNDKLEVVPCSRSDVFATKRISVIEKRMLMKLLSSINDSEDAIDDLQNITFQQFLIEKKLPPNLVHYILYAMSGSTNETCAIEGINSTKRFLKSVGRFGKTPFLFSMYGSGETTQAFCRLSAVFGGVFALNQDSILGLTVENNKVRELLNATQKIHADNFVINAQLVPRSFIPFQRVEDYISRAIFITDRSIMASEQEHLTLLIWPPKGGKHLTTVIEMGSLTGTCPKDYFLVHLIAKQTTRPEEDFEHIVTRLFTLNTPKSSENELADKPTILWSCYFSLPSISNLKFGQSVPDNLHICGGSDLDLDYDSTIKNAQSIFHEIYPDSEFLPRAPDPEEIIIGDENATEVSKDFISPDTNET